MITDQDRAAQQVAGESSSGGPKRIAVDDDGKAIAIIRAEAGEGQAPDGVNVTTSSTEILAANASRKWAVIVNDSDTTMYLAIGQDAEVNKGIRLNARGGVIVISRTGDIFSTQAVNGIHGGSGNKVATVQEAQ